MALARPIAVIDSETDPFKHDRIPQPFIWGFYEGERFRTFPDADKMLRFLSDKNYVIYAHNGGKFDYHYMLDFLEPYSDILVINGRLAKFVIGQCEFRDSYNILPVPLRDYKKDDFDYNKMEKAVRHKHMPEIIRYLEHDCKYLYELIQTFIGEYGRKLTLAGAALDYWSKKFTEDKPESTQEFYQSLSGHYYGGRVQCFSKGIIRQDFHVVDIHSAYPFAMLHEHPISTNFNTKTSVSLKEKIIPDSFYTIAAVSRGALPYREDKKDSLSFPDDDKVRIYKITGWELQAGIDTKTLDVRSIEKRYDFGKTINFKGYVSHFYEMKKKAQKNTAEYVIAKLFLNGCYGKFGSNPDNYSTYGIAPIKMATSLQSKECKGIKLGKYLGPWLWAGVLGRHALMEGAEMVTEDYVEDGEIKKRTRKEKNPTNSKFYNVATAASITGFVRAYLWRHICKVRDTGGLVHYCDTDSIVFKLDKPQSEHPFCYDPELGNWEHEGVFRYGGIAGKKLYAFEYADVTYNAMCEKAKKKGDPVPCRWKCASKGVKLEHGSIMEIASGKVVEWVSDKPNYTISQKPKAGLPVDTPLTMKFLRRNAKMT